MRTLLVLIMLLLSFGSMAKNKDAEIREALIGTWVKSINDPHYNEFGFITEYRSDGKVIHRDFRTKKCELLDALTVGSWVVKNGLLTIKVESSKGTYPLPVGASVTDRVVKIDELSQELETSKGKRIYRTKSESCV